MAVGDLVFTDHQYEYAGLLLGSGTNYVVEEVEGLFGIPNISSSDLDRNDSHGVVPGVDLMGGRTLTFKMKVYATDGTLFSKVASLQTAMRPRQIEDLLVYQKPGYGKRYIKCRPRRSEFPSDYEMAHGLAKPTVQLFASDPRHFALTGSSVSGSIATSATSVTLPTATNSGNWTTEPVITIGGPANNVRITVSGQTAMDGISDNNKTIGIDCTMNTGDSLVIDVAKKTVTLNGTARYDLKRTDSKWWSLFPGANTIVVQRAAGNVGSAAAISVAWNHAYIY